jgi:hypothetical protein
MVFPKLTRKRIQASGSKPVEIPWPTNGPEPKKNRSYTIQSSSTRPGDDRLRVLSVEEVANGFRVLVKLDADPVRLLGKTSGYVSSSAGAMPTRAVNDKGGVEVEPEAVDARYQELLSQEGRMKTAMQGATNRQRAKVTASEQKLADERKKGKPGKLAQAQFQRQRKHLRRAA